jgi:hypothetical protein
MSAIGHCLTLIKGTRKYDEKRSLPLLTASCSCGGWDRSVHRFDADTDEWKGILRADHHVHATVVTSTPRWPEDANDLHPLLNGSWHGDLVTGEHAKHHVPLEAGGLAKGTSYSALTKAIRLELGEALGHDDVVPLERAPRLAAAIALTRQLTLNWPKVQAWRVMVRQPNDPRPLTGKGKDGWCFLAFQTREQAELYAPWIAGHLNRDRREPDSVWLYVATVDFGPAEITRLQVPGRVPEQDYELRAGNKDKI